MNAAALVLGLSATIACSAAGASPQSTEGAAAFVPAPGAEDGPARSELAGLVERWSADREALERRNDCVWSPDHRRTLKAFHEAWRARLDEVDFDALGREGRVDWLLLENRIERELHQLALRESRLVEAVPLLPFADLILRLHDARRRREPVDPEAAATALSGVAKSADEARKALDPGEGRPATPSKSVARRAAGIVDTLASTLSSWYRFHEGYDPLFTWWAQAPHKKADEALKAYAKALREKIVGAKEGEDEPIVGDPIGREALLEELRLEMIAYAPEELVAIAERELEWCRERMLEAAREMGCGEDWKAALEKVKQDHVAPGEQTRLIRELSDEAVAFLDARGLVTVPPLAREVWRMEMLSPEAQKSSPFFLGGEVIRVSFPTDDMAHEDKLMSMRGNNRHFSRAVVHHELIPGHHLQGFMTSRHATWRRFGTPFWTEGWAFYWETLLWDLGFPRTPEDRVGFLFWRMHRCARVVFSLGFHLGKLSPQECVDLLVDRVGHERANATAEVRRSFDGSYGPLYQIAYMMGALQFRALHADLVGSGRVSDRAFHDAVLQGGAMPVEMIRARLLELPLSRSWVPAWRYAGEPR